MAPGVKIGCQSCRRRHVKCDSSQPVCETCQRTGTECQWDDQFRFCHDFNPSVESPTTLKDTFTLSSRVDGFSTDQKWLTTPKKLSFVDEFQQLQSHYERETNFNVNLYPAIEEAPLEEDGTAAANVLELQVSPELEQEPLLTPNPSSTYTPCTNGCLCLERFPSILDSRPEPVPLVSKSLQISPWSPNSSVSPLPVAEGTPSDTSHRHSFHNDSFEPDSAWPLRNAEEAYLMRHFIDALSATFDLCDPNRHFANIAPRRAVSNSTLRNAIFAASARHLSITTDYDPYVADRYHQICLRALIPILDNPSALMDSDLFAATVILRLFEELDVALAGRDAQGHVRGTRLLFCAQKYTEIASGLGQAAFWVALRQEIHIALTTQRPVLGTLEQCNIDLTLSPANDFVWAYRALAHTATISRFCFGDRNEQLVERWQELVDYQLQWRRRRPIVFDPLFYSNSPENTRATGFPLVHYLGEAHVIAAQHHLLSCVLLTVYNPYVPRIGLDSHRMASVATEDIKRYVLELCGTALSNPTVAPAHHAACIGISMCGTRFEDRSDQEKLIYTLKRIEKEHAWPTIYWQEQLKEAWRWDDGGNCMPISLQNQP